MVLWVDGRRGRGEEEERRCEMWDVWNETFYWLDFFSDITCVPDTANKGNDNEEEGNDSGDDSAGADKKQLELEEAKQLWIGTGEDETDFVKLHLHNATNSIHHWSFGTALNFIRFTDSTNKSRYAAMDIEKGG
jgi:hypothetical protein